MRQIFTLTRQIKMISCGRTTGFCPRGTVQGQRAHTDCLLKGITYHQLVRRYGIPNDLSNLIKIHWCDPFFKRQYNVVEIMLTLESENTGSVSAVPLTSYEPGKE